MLFVQINRLMDIKNTLPCYLFTGFKSCSRCSTRITQFFLSSRQNNIVCKTCQWLAGALGRVARWKWGEEIYFLMSWRFRITQITFRDFLRFGRCFFQILFQWIASFEAGLVPKSLVDAEYFNYLLCIWMWCICYWKYVLMKFSWLILT